MLNSKIKKLFLVLLLAFGFIKVDAIVDATSNYYINDYASVLSDETQKYIYDRSITLDQASKIQVVVTTVKSLEGMSIEEYANSLYNKLQIGEDSKGALILLCPDERLIRIEIGDGLGGILPDGKVGRILDDYAIPSLKNDNWNEGIKNAYDAVYQTIVEEYNLNIDYTIPTRPFDSDDSGDSYEGELTYCLYAFLFGLFFGLIVNGIIYRKNYKKAVNIFMIFLIIHGLMLMFGTIFPKYVILVFLSMSSTFGYIMTLGGSGSSSGSSRYGSYHSSSSHSSSSSIGGHGGHSSGGGASRGF